MAYVHHASAWTLKLPDDWTCEASDQAAVLVARRGDALLRVSELKNGSSGLTPEGWVATAAWINRRMQRDVQPVRCGAFTGELVEFASANAWYRGWLLAGGGVGLDVTYTCPIGEAGRDDGALAAILDTLNISGRAA